MTTLSDFKALMVPGAVVEVTNHYIPREEFPDHPCSGTRQRVVTGANSNSWQYECDGTACIKWPKAGNIIAGDNGSFMIYGHPTADALWLTIPSRHCERCTMSTLLTYLTTHHLFPQILTNPTHHTRTRYSTLTVRHIDS